MALLSWAEYSALHDIVTTETTFSGKEMIAEQDVSRVIGPIRWAELINYGIEGEFYADQLKECIAKVIDYNEEIQPKVGGGVASVSNDGYSESYNTELQTASQAAAEKSKMIRAWLSGTGLVGAY